MAVAQNDVLRVTAEMSQGVDALQNVYHIQSDNVASVSDAQALLDMGLIMDGLYNLVDASMHDGVSFDSVRVQNVTQGVLMGSTPFPVLTVGLDTNDPLPFQAAALITYPTATPKTRGGTYFGGFTEANSDTAGAISSALQTVLVAVGVKILTQQNVAGNLYTFVLVNRLLGTVIPYVSAIVHAVWRTQRRRRPGVGS